MTECDKYLGLPMASGKSKVGTFKELQEKITKRVLGWKENLYQRRVERYQDSGTSNTYLFNEFVQTP